MGHQAELLAILGDRRELPEHGTNRIILRHGLGTFGRCAEPSRFLAGRYLFLGQLLLGHGCRLGGHPGGSAAYPAEETHPGPPGVDDVLGLAADPLELNRRRAHRAEQRGRDAHHGHDLSGFPHRGQEGGGAHEQEHDDSQRPRQAALADEPCPRLLDVIPGSGQLLGELLRFVFGAFGQALRLADFPHVGDRLLGRDGLDDLVDEAGPQVGLRVVPGVEGNHADVLQVAVGRTVRGQLGDHGVDPAEDEGFARSPVAEQADRQRGLELAGGDQRRQGEGVTVGLKQVDIGAAVRVVAGNGPGGGKRPAQRPHADVPPDRHGQRAPG